MRSGSDQLHEDWLGKSIPIWAERVVLTQAIRDESSVSFFNLLDNFNLGIQLGATFLFSFIGILSFSLLLGELSHRIRFGARRTISVWKRIRSAIRSFVSNQLSAIGLFFVFVDLFIWVTQLFLTNNVKTNKVVRDHIRNECRSKRPEKFSFFSLGGGHQPTAQG